MDKSKEIYNDFGIRIIHHINENHGVWRHEIIRRTDKRYVGWYRSKSKFPTNYAPPMIREACSKPEEITIQRVPKGKDFYFKVEVRYGEGGKGFSKWVDNIVYHIFPDKDASQLIEIQSTAMFKRCDRISIDA